MANNNWIWVLDGEPKNIVITDKEGNKRSPDLAKVKKNARLKPALVAGGRYGKGVGNLFYGGPLGDRGALEAKGNKYTTNTQILKALGYVKGEQANPPKETEETK